MRTFELNGKKYNAKPFDFNMICEFEDFGLSMAALATKPTVAVRAYIAICGGIDLEAAGKEISEHIIGGGNLNEVTEALNAEMEKSDFFLALAKTTEESNKKGKSKAE